MLRKLFLSINLLWIFLSIAVAKNSLISRIQNGFPTKPHEFKYVVSVQLNRAPFCTGGIIAENFVLTAAHCVISQKSNAFMRGSYRIVANVTDLSPNPSQIIRKVAEVYVPNAYNGSFWKTTVSEADIAVLRLRDGLNLEQNEDLQALRLPTVDKQFENAIATFAGFGFSEVKTVDGKVVMSHQPSKPLLKAKVKITDIDNCHSYAPRHVWETILCGKVKNSEIGEEPQGICNGDSGGPLVYGKDLVIGVASTNGNSCDSTRRPNYYTKVFSYVQFIKDAMNRKTDGMRVRKF